MLSRYGDPLEVLERTVDFEYFRVWLVEGLGYADGSKGGRPPFDPVMMFKILILQAQHNLSDARTEYMIRDRLSWMRSEEHTSELQSLMRISYAVFCLKKKNKEEQKYIE